MSDDQRENMSDGQNIDDILKSWDFRIDQPVVRLLLGKDGRDVLQIRVDMGVLQLEIEGRPDGTTPHSHKTYLDYLKQLSLDADEMDISDEHCVEIDREFAQFYHRRVCWLQLRNFDNAIRDADHTLRLMDFCKEFSDDEQWTVSHEQYRPFVLFHRTQASALAALGDEEDEGAEKAVEEINLGLSSLNNLFAKYDAEDQFEEDELVKRLIEMREDLRTRFEIGKTLQEQLAEAVTAEDYELAAKIRDKITHRDSPLH